MYNFLYLLGEFIGFIMVILVALVILCLIKVAINNIDYSILLQETTNIKEILENLNIDIIIQIKD
jgi:hypothetical protein